MCTTHQLCLPSFSADPCGAARSVNCLLVPSQPVVTQGHSSPAAVRCGGVTAGPFEIDGMLASHMRCLKTGCNFDAGMINMRHLNLPSQAHHRRFLEHNRRSGVLDRLDRDSRWWGQRPVWRERHQGSWRPGIMLSAAASPGGEILVTLQHKPPSFLATACIRKRDRL